jgi:hypothetical protein
MTTLMGEHQCHLCPARLYDDNSFALHIGRHRRLQAGSSADGDRQTNRRQAERSMIEDLMEILHG